MKEKIIKNIPNSITISRIISSIMGSLLFVSGSYHLSFIAYTYGAISDFFDGLMARKLNAYSELGRKLDAVSDKLYAMSLLLPSIICGNLLMLIPLMYEFKIARINYKSFKLGYHPETIRVGKFKTALLFPTIIIGLLATKWYEFYFLLASILPITTLFEIKTANSYENILNDRINNDNEKIDNTNNLTINKSREIDNSLTRSNEVVSNNLIEEFNYYLYTPVEKKKSKVKVLRRKL